MCSKEKPLPPPPPPRRSSDYYDKSDSAEIDRIRAQELKELQKLREMERRKQAIEEEIAREKQHLINLQLLELDSIEKARAARPKAAVQYETMVATKMGKSPTPPPLPNPPTEKDLMKLNEETAEAEREKGLKKLQTIHSQVNETKQEIEDLKRRQVEELKERNKRLHQKEEGFSVDSTIQV